MKRVFLIGPSIIKVTCGGTKEIEEKILLIFSPRSSENYVNKTNSEPPKLNGRGDRLIYVYQSKRKEELYGEKHE